MSFLLKYIKYIEAKYNLLIGSTNYSKQYKLEEEIPEIKFNEKDIRTNIIFRMFRPQTLLR
jgi:hypothetical protein